MIFLWTIWGIKVSGFWTDFVASLFISALSVLIDITTSTGGLHGTSGASRTGDDGGGSRCRVFRATARTVVFICVAYCPGFPRTANDAGSRGPMLKQHASVTRRNFGSQ